MGKQRSADDNDDTVDLAPGERCADGCFECVRLSGDDVIGTGFPDLHIRKTAPHGYAIDGRTDGVVGEIAVRPASPVFPGPDAGQASEPAVGHDALCDPVRIHAFARCHDATHAIARCHDATHAIGALDPRERDLATAPGGCFGYDRVETLAAAFGRDAGPDRSRIPGRVR